MDKSVLRKSDFSRQIVEISEDNYNVSDNKPDSISRIKFGDSTLNLSPQDISKSIEIIDRVFSGVIDIWKIHEQGKQTVRAIEAEIQKIQQESKAEIDKINKNQAAWNEKFDKKTAFFFLTIEKLEKSSVLSMEIKQAILENLKVMLYADK
jgi:UDP-galactopyranose mutase